MNLHLGCGPIHLPGFINIDIEPSHNPDVLEDYIVYLAELGDNSVDQIYTCHSFEHLGYPSELVFCLSQCHRVLKPGGTLRIVVPDLMKVARKYVNGEDLRDIYDGKFYYYKDFPAERFMYFAREWEHKVLFDFRLMAALCCDAGFAYFKECKFNQSDTPCLRGLDRFESESGVYECRK